MKLYWRELRPSNTLHLRLKWTDKPSLKFSIDNCFENSQSSYIKLKLLESNHGFSKQVLKTCFSTYLFPFLFYLLILKKILSVGNIESILVKTIYLQMYFFLLTSLSILVKIFRIGNSNNKKSTFVCIVFCSDRCPSNDL